MEQSLVLTFDVGTQSARCLLVNESGDFEDKEQENTRFLIYQNSPDGQNRPRIFILTL